LRNARIAGIVGKLESKFAWRTWSGEANRSAIVNDPIGAAGKEFGVVCGGADAKYAASGGLTGADAGGSVFDDDAIASGKAESGGSLEIRFGIGLATLDVTGRDHVANEMKNARCTKTDFGEFADGGGDHSELVRREMGK